MISKAKVAVIDGGGRGAALVAAYAKSEHVGSVIAIPGNDMMKVRSRKPILTFPGVGTTSVKEIVDICRSSGVCLVDVAQDNAVASGLVDALRGAGINALGPTRSAGEIEWNKAFARELGRELSLPQPEYVICRSERDGMDYVSTKPEAPVFVKASGLAEGKGAIPATNLNEAEHAIKEMSRSGDAGKTFLIEEWLRNHDGTNAEEFSTFAISDGSMLRILGSAQDHKRVDDLEKGPNTGGMGCSAPPLALTAPLISSVEEMFKTVISGLNAHGRRYNGILYLGGMLRKEGGDLKPYVVEWNARWGDPEAQVLIPGIKTDMFEMSFSAARGDISDLNVRTDGKSRVVVAGVSLGYPGDCSAVKGKQIFGLHNLIDIDGIDVYGAGIKIEDGKYYANGGRLFYIVGEGNDVVEARSRAYFAMSHVSIEGDNLHYRKNIGWRDVARLKRW